MHTVARRKLNLIRRTAILVLALAALFSFGAHGQDIPTPERTSWIFQPPIEMDDWWNARSAIERMLIVTGALVVSQLGIWTRFVVLFVPAMILFTVGNIMIMIQARNLWWLVPGGAALFVAFGAIGFRRTFLK